MPKRWVSMDDIDNRQKYIFEKIQNNMYGYTTVPQDEKLYMIVDLLVKWIDAEMQRKEHENE